jgi:protein TonB
LDEALFMKRIRLGGFAAALAIHGGLLATVLPVNEAMHSGGGINPSSMTLAISYQPLAIIDQAENVEAIAATDTAADSDAEPAPIVEAKQRVERVPKKITAPQQLTEILKEINLPVADTKPADIDDTLAEITQAAMAAENETVGIHELVINEPVFSESPAVPHYPVLARKRGQQGTVWIDVIVGGNGKQMGVDIFQSSGVGQLDRAALAAVRNWKFIPHRINNVAVVSRLRIPVEFSLE